MPLFANLSLAVFAASAFVSQGAPAAPEAVRLRPACFDSHNLPKVFTPLDVKRTQNGWPALNANDFYLFEDGAKTSAASSIQKFRDTNMGLALIVALDASGSMNGRPMRAIQDGLAQLVGRKRSQDRIAILSFADETRWETRWDSSEQANQDALRNLKTRGNLTRLYDALEDASSEFDRQAAKDDGFPIRRCILVISDGHDEGSHVSLSRLLADVAQSRVRLDAIGLAHSPLWLGSLRQLARAGYGEFQTAALPEDLTNMVSRGIDSLLDMPALKFHAQRFEADGKTHRIGLQYGAAEPDQIFLKLPEPFWRTRRALYIAAALLALLILLIFALGLRSRKPVPVPAPPISLQPDPAPPPVRVATVAEPSSPPSRSFQTAAPVISYGGSQPAAAAAVKPVRVPTALAPNPAAAPLHLSLSAVSGPYTGQTFPITEEEFWIGAAPNNHLCLAADQGVSGNHVCIRRELPYYRLYDNGSLNNTWVNGRAVGKDVTLIQPGDRIRIGASQFSVGAAD